MQSCIQIWKEKKGRLMEVPYLLWYRASKIICTCCSHRDGRREQPEKNKNFGDWKRTFTRSNKRITNQY